MTVVSRLWCLAILAVAGCADGSVPNQVACDDCTIEMQQVAKIGSENGPGSLTGRPVAVYVDGRGRYWISVLDAFSLIYDSSAAFLQQFGRPGDGPGEFRSVRILATLPGDSMLVSDFPNHYVIGPDLEIARTISGSHDHQLGQLKVFEWPDEMIASASSFNRASRSSTSYIVRYDMSSDSGVPRDTVMTIEAEGSSGAAYASSIRVIGEPSSDGVWISHLNRYRLLRMQRTGVTEDSLERKIDWFPGGEPMVIGGPDQPTNPQMMSNWVDDQGRLWTLVAKPRQNTDAWKGINVQGGEARVAALPADYELNETFIEVIDTVARRVIARHVFDGYVSSVLPGNRVAAYRETDDGIPVLYIYQLTLTGTHR